MSESTTFFPDWASPPGATITDLLRERGQSIADFASAMGDSVDHIQNLLNGTAHITDNIADHLASVVGGSPRFWLSRETQFRESLARLAKNEEWLQEFPIHDLVRFRWIHNATSIEDKIAACLDYFGVATVAQWHERYEGGARLAAFRTSSSFDSAEGAVLAWLRKGEIDSGAMQCEKWNPKRFRDTLPAICSLTRERDPVDFIPKLQTLCSECGVAVVIARAPSGCRASGVTRFISADKALLMLSFRYLSDDHFWFTFFHEAGHLLLHDSKALFLEGGDFCAGIEEDEANQFASEQLISGQYQKEMLNLPVDGRAVIRFARKIGIAPGIVVGQLQHLGVFTHKQLNNLKTKYKWAAD